MEDPHCEQQLLRGFLPFRRRRGVCEVRGTTANLWYAAARALGFDIGTIRCPNTILLRQVVSLCPGAKRLAPLTGRVRRPRNLPDVVFSDLDGVPTGPDAILYWKAWTTPHVFFCGGLDDSNPLITLGSPTNRKTPLTPRGWTARSVCLAHSDTGGATSGRWTFVVWYPPGFPFSEPLVWEPRGGTPLLCCVNDRERATPFSGSRPDGSVGAGVTLFEGLVMDFGLFPAFDLEGLVLVESSGSPSGYGSRRLTPGELGSLWDVPILFLDTLSTTEVASIMAEICKSPHSKLLHTGADVLLTDVFLGGCKGSSRVGRDGGGPGSGKFYRETLKVAGEIPGEATTTSPGWTTYKADPNWKLTWTTRRTGIDVGGTATTSWAYRSSAISALFATWLGETRSTGADGMSSR